METFKVTEVTGMTNYFEDLRKIENLVKQKYYPSSMMRSVKLIELGLKELYKNLEEYLEQNGKSDGWEKMHVDFFRLKKEQFEFQNASLGSLVIFARYTSFWDHVKEMCDSNLRFVKMVNWEHIRKLRNIIVHDDFEASRFDALEMLFWTKVFLYESGLISGKKNPIPEILDTECAHCETTMSLSWNYCPECGKSARSVCPACSQITHHNHRVCFHCDSVIIPSDYKGGSAERKIYKSYAEAVWADWVVTPIEREWLQQKRLELGLTLDQAQEIELEVIPKNYFMFMEIIDATKVDGSIDRYEREFLAKKAEKYSIPKEVAQQLIKAASSNRSQKTSIKRIMELISLNGLL
ncbi:zinc ribbon domain-containing protein [Aquiflexum sp.]|uniref:zinc ribbon domain-containing protein n=1 Tax=Aquiflexum sp. TaxID=1872584 RepID=UPI003594665B